VVDGVAETVVVVGSGHGVEGVVNRVVAIVVVLCVVVGEVDIELVLVVSVIVVAIVAVVVVELATVVLMEVELLFVTSLQSPSTPPVLEVLQASANFSLQENKQLPPLHSGISKVPSGICSQPSVLQQ
jgi:hypothetical protein